MAGKLKKKGSEGLEIRDNLITIDVNTSIPCVNGDVKWLVLGMTHALEYVFYNPEEGALLTIDIDKLTTKKAEAQFGLSRDEAVLLLSKLPRMVSRSRIDAKQTIGNGIFASRSGNEYFIVNGSRVINVHRTFKSESFQFEISHTPLVGDKIVNVRNAVEWLNTDKLAKSESPMHDLYEEFDKLRKILSCWHWESPDAPKYLAAFIMLAPFQRIMTWRPSLWITGRPRTGKTWFFNNVLEKLYGKLIVKLGNSTAYGAIQKLSGNSCIGILDNFEPNRRTLEFMTTMEIASSGGDVTRGSPNKEAISYDVAHMLWYNAVVLSPETAAVDSRIVEFHLANTFDSNKFVGIDSLSVSIERIIPALFEAWDDIEGYRKLFLGHHNDRLADNIGYAHALLAYIGVIDPASSSFFDLPRFVQSRETVDEATELLNTILLHSVLPDGATDYSEQSKQFVYEAITRDARSIVRKGVWLVRDKNDDQWIAINPFSVKNELLRDTAYAQLTKEQVKRLLLNVPGAKKSKSKDAKNTAVHVVFIPASYISDIEDTNDSQID